MAGKRSRDPARPTGPAEGRVGRDGVVEPELERGGDDGVVQPELERGGHDGVAEPELERAGRRLGRPGWWWLLIAGALALPGLLLVLFTGSWAWSLGLVLLLLSTLPAVVGIGLLLSGLVMRWSARHRSFA